VHIVPLLAMVTWKTYKANMGCGNHAEAEATRAIGPVGS
jgi:hypothetical protein